MPINQGSGKVPEQLALQYRDHWKQLLSRPTLISAFRYLLDGNIESASSFELSLVDLPEILSPATTALRFYPGAFSLDIDAAGPTPQFTPLVQAVRENSDPVEFSDYFLLYPVEVALDAAAEPVPERPAGRMTEITIAEREQFRRNWAALTTEQIRAAFLDTERRPLEFQVFENTAEQDHLSRLRSLADEAGDEARLLLHLGHVGPEKEVPIQYRSVLEVQGKDDSTVSFDDMNDCPPWCEPPK